MSKKRKEVQLPDLKGITVVQSNRVTNAKYDYTLLQERVFTFIMYYLQTEIQQVMSGKAVLQLDIFNNVYNSVFMNIPMNVLGKPNQYAEIRSAITKIAGVQIEMRNIAKQTVKISGLFSSVEMPDKQPSKYQGHTVIIEIRKDIAMLLIDVNFAQNKPQQYTKYMLYVALTAQFKYTSKIYKILCSYRERTSYNCSLQEFREQLQVPENVYVNYNDFKRFVLIPVANELKLHADLYFDPEATDFVQKQGRKVVGLKFTLLYPMTDEMMASKIKILKVELFRTFGCGERHWEQIEPTLTIDTNWNEVNRIVDRCYYLCTNRKVDHPAAHVTRAILNGVVPE